NDDINALRERCATLEALIQHCEADGLAACLALQEAMTHIQRGQAPDTATWPRWIAALQPFAGNALLNERAAAGAVADAASAHITAGLAVEADPERHREALSYASYRLRATLIAYYRARARTAPVQPEPAVLAELAELERSQTNAAYAVAALAAVDAERLAALADATALRAACL